MIKTILILLTIYLSASSVAIGRTNTFWDKDVCVQGQIKDFPKDGENGHLYIADAVRKTGYPIVIAPDSAGRFSVSFPLPYAQRTYIIFNEKFIPLYLNGCDTIYIDIQWKQDKDTPLIIKYTGESAVINQELLQAQSVKFIKTPFPEDNGVGNDSVRMDFCVKVEQAYQEYVAGLLQVCKQGRFLPETQKLLLDEALLSLGEHLVYYDNVSYMTGVNPVLKDPGTDPYYSFFQQIPWNDISLLSTAVFPSFIELFDYSSLLHKKWKLQHGPEILFRTLEEAGIKLTAEEKRLKKRQPDKLEALEKGYQDSALFPIAQQLLFRKLVFHEDLHLKQGVVWDILNYRLLNNYLGTCPDRSVALAASTVVLKNLKDPRLRMMVKETVDKAFPEGQVPMENFILPEGKAADVFRRITEPHKGKVLLLDVWATWCAPCVAGIEEMQPLRKKYSGRDVVFIFISSEKNSPVAAFNRIMDAADGVKYRLSENDYNYFCQLFKINTIPRYILVDRLGNITDADYKLRDVDNMLEKLLK